MSEQKIDTRLWSSIAKNLTPYIPGEQPKHDNLCKLNTNENPYPPSPKVAEAIIAALANQAQNLQRYPAPESDELRQALADIHDLALDQVFVGNGSDEVLALVFASFFIKERPLLAPDISYSFYPVYAQTFGVTLINIPLAQDFSIHPHDYRRPCGGIILANPNAPTGLLLSLDDIRNLVSEHSNAVVVIDEAYIDFATPKGSTARAVSAINLINEFENLLVTQTFSKSRSLAGLRVGAAFGNVSLIEALTRMKNSFNSYPLDKLAQVGAVASLKDEDYFKKTCHNVITLREHLSSGLTQLGFEVLPSHANFVFAKPKHKSAKDIAQQLREQGIIIRYFDKPRINEYVRISVGDSQQIKRLLMALKEMMD